MGARGPGLIALKLGGGGGDSQFRQVLENCCQSVPPEDFFGRHGFLQKIHLGYFFTECPQIDQI